MDSTEIRRLFISDEEWDRTSATWKLLKPLRDFNCRRESDESPHQHYLRLLPLFNIPVEVIEQWLYPLYYNEQTVNNYGWLDYDMVCFDLEHISVRQLAQLHVVTRYEQYVRKKEASIPFDGFACRSQDKEHWQTMGTWRVPPIVIDISTLPNIPRHSDMKGSFQLVEGHSRLGYLLAMFRAGLLADDSQHLVYRMYVSENTGKADGPGSL
jgi:hypothetical protein